MLLCTTEGTLTLETQAVGRGQLKQGFNSKPTLSLLCTHKKNCGKASYWTLIKGFPPPHPVKVLTSGKGRFTAGYRDV